MKESVTYQAIVEEGKVEGIVEAQQEVLLQLGWKRFGAPDSSSEMAIRAIRDPDRLARLINSLLEVSSWEELVATK